MGALATLNCLSADDLALARQPVSAIEAESWRWNDKQKASCAKWNLPRAVVCKALLRAYPDNPTARAFSTATTGHWSRYRHIFLERLLEGYTAPTIVECGAGISTVLMADLLRQKAERTGLTGMIHAYEQDPRYFGDYERAFPAHLRQFVTLQLLPIRLDTYGDYRGLSYAADYPRHVDLLYIDGPTRSRGCPDCDFKYFYLCADLLRMLREGTVVELAVTDKRFWNEIAFREQLGDRYDISTSRLWSTVSLTRRQTPA